MVRLFVCKKGEKELEPITEDGVIEFKVIDKESGEIEIIGDNSLMLSVQQMMCITPEKTETPLITERKE